MTIETAYKCLCGFLAALTLIAFVYAGALWGLGAGTASIILMLGLLWVGAKIQEHIDHHFKYKE